MTEFKIGDHVKSSTGSTPFLSPAFEGGVVTEIDAGDDSCRVRLDNVNASESEEWYYNKNLELVSAPKADPMQLMDEVAQFVELTKGVVAQFIDAGFTETEARAITVHIITHSGAK